MQTIDHSEAAQHPPAVTDVLKLLRTTVQASVTELTFAEPCPKPIFVYQVQSLCNGQRSQTCEDLTSMRFCPWTNAEAAIEISAALDVFHCQVDVHK